MKIRSNNDENIILNRETIHADFLKKIYIYIF